MLDDIIFFIYSTVLVCVVFFAIFIGVTWVKINYIDNIPSIVKVDGKIVYEGSSAGFDVQSSGANTTITIKDGFLYLFPKSIYTSNKVEIVGVK